LIISQNWSFIVDANTMNMSQSHRLLIMTKYLGDQENYFYWMVLHMNILYIGSGIITLGIGTWKLTYIKDICGILKIARYERRHMSIIILTII